MTRATDLIAAERQRQIDSEGYDAEHDRGASRNLALAAAAYALNAAGEHELADEIWPWSRQAHKPVSPDRDLVRAGALIAAAIEAPR